MVFYAYENATVAAAIVLGRGKIKKHTAKGALAKEFFQDGKLKTDISKLLPKLDRLRKDVQYGEPDSELASVDLEDLVGDLETFLDEVDALIDEIEES